MTHSDWIEDELYPALISSPQMTHIIAYLGKVTGVVQDPCPADFCMDKNTIWIDIILSVYVYWDKTLDVQDQLCNFVQQFLLTLCVLVKDFCWNIILHMVLFLLMSRSIMLYWSFNFFLALYLMCLAHQISGTCANSTKLKKHNSMQRDDFICNLTHESLVPWYGVFYLD